ncbi:peptide/nickel transport system permease protein [Roseovarius nanhaiticus]|uniref:Peptide/nickel transport system permease protein n=1 Tax=Roseovarius nanhaiticus TaxID=573024 RepID=A0A1N7HEG2_9RHOB|nr:ABC transporter permease [Roseovarius nanhaiticus]SEL00102.1 peptide/nickel transport system permease protein [Roseovarius nanhaiticus]SIS23131.1 peptide/nickel transport system permease protein [Roseovarius nanhaiticus]
MTRRLPLGAALLGAIAAFVLIGPLVWSVSPGAVDLAARSQGASPAHPLGTDQLGRDALARLMAGGRLSLAVGLTAMGISLTLGAAIGIAGGLSRRLNGPLMRLTDLFLALPLLPLLLIAATLFRAPLSAAMGAEAGLFVLITVAIGATSWMAPARILCAEVQTLAQRDFIRAARSTGTRLPQMIWRHILPAIAAPLGVSAALAMASAILMESALSFLGLGFPPDMASWGRLLHDGTAHLGTHPGRALWPGALITATALAATLLADLWRDLADPYKGRHR